MLRGINVGGRNVLPMKDLRAILEELGLKNVQTYIQSGNCVFDCEDGDALTLSGSIADHIQQKQKFRPQVLVITKDDLLTAIADNPYPAGEDEPKNVHLFFLSEPAVNPELIKLEQVKKPSENFALLGSVFYLHTPEGFNSSKVATKVEKALGVAVTARNLRSANQIAELATK